MDLGNITFWKIVFQWCEIKNDTFKNIEIQIQEITKLALTKLITTNVSNQDIQDSIRAIQNKTVN